MKMPQKKENSKNTIFSIQLARVQITFVYAMASFIEILH